VIFLHDLVIQAEQECTPMSSRGGAGRQAHFGIQHGDEGGPVT
jgi:hypothetical protein